MKRWVRLNGSLVNRKKRRAEEKETNYFLELLKVIKHFFPDFMKWLKEVKDPRHESYIYHDVCIVLLVRLFGAAMGIKSMRNLTEKFNKAECIDNLKTLLNDENIIEIPHYDTINDLLNKLDTKELKILRHKLIAKLIQMKCFYSQRFKKRWLVSIDGTKLFTFKERHCEHCLTKKYNKGTKDEYTLYFHYVLEAKLTIGDMVFSLCSEFIENPKNLEKQNYSKDFDEKAKQDCELNAFYRMEKNLKKEYPRLPICLLLDSLYANQNVFQICKENDWEYIVRFKEGSLRNVAKEFEILSQYDNLITTKERDNILQTYRYTNEIDHEGHKINVIEYKEVTQAPDKEEPDMATFTFITSPGLKITKKNQEETVLVGRKRWKIENQGFNEQKNHGYELTHPFSHNYTAMKNHYMLIQIAHIIKQLFEEGIKILKEFKKSLADISDSILEDFRNKVLLLSDIDYMNTRCQIRLNTALQ